MFICLLFFAVLLLLFVEERKSRRKSSVLSNLHSRPHVIVNNYPENENTSQGITLFQVMSLMRMLLNLSKNLDRTYTQLNSNFFVTHRIYVRNSKRGLDTGHAQVKTFANSKEIAHYVTRTLEDGNFDVAILQFGVNDML